MEGSPRLLTHQLIDRRPTGFYQPIALLSSANRTGYLPNKQHWTKVVFQERMLHYRKVLGDARTTLERVYDDECWDDEEFCDAYLKVVFLL